MWHEVGCCLVWAAGWHVCWWCGCSRYTLLHITSNVSAQSGWYFGSSSSSERKAARCTWAQNLLLRPSSELCMPEILMQSAKEAQLEVAAFDHTRLALLSILQLLLRSLQLTCSLRPFSECAVKTSTEKVRLCFGYRRVAKLIFEQPDLPRNVARRSTLFGSRSPRPRKRVSGL